jgi:hypothetical protein
VVKAPAIFATKAQRLKETQRRTLYPKREQKRRKGFATFSPFYSIKSSCLFAFLLPALCLPASLPFKVYYSTI